MAAPMLQELVDTCPNVVGVKYAVGDVVRFATLVDTFRAGDLAWICGLAEPWAPFFWVAGATGFTSGLANVEPGLSLEMLRWLRDGDYDGAMGVWRSVKPFEELRARRNSANNVPVVKEALASWGCVTDACVHHSRCWMPQSGPRSRRSWPAGRHLPPPPIRVGMRSCQRSMLGCGTPEHPYA